MYRLNRWDDLLSAALYSVPSISLVATAANMVHPAVDPKRNPPTAEVDFKLKSGNAWSHNFLNQKHWHPLSYPNQKRKWIAEQKHAQHARANDTISKEVRTAAHTARLLCRLTGSYGNERLNAILVFFPIHPLIRTGNHSNLYLCSV